MFIFSFSASSFAGQRSSASFHCCWSFGWLTFWHLMPECTTPTVIRRRRRRLDYCNSHANRIIGSDGFINSPGHSPYFLSTGRSKKWTLFFHSYNVNNIKYARKQCFAVILRYLWIIVCNQVVITVIMLNILSYTNRNRDYSQSSATICKITSQLMTII